MLSKPEHGWTDFSLGANTYFLSYLTNIPMDWLDQAIRGLEILKPFAVHGFCEPCRMICTVSYWNCHIIYEDDDRYELSEGEARWEIVHISMLEFCKRLHNDILENLDDWCKWNPVSASDNAEAKHVLEKNGIQERLNRLQELIKMKEVAFDDHHGFI